MIRERHEAHTRLEVKCPEVLEGVLPDRCHTSKKGYEVNAPMAFGSNEIPINGPES